MSGNNYKNLKTFTLYNIKMEEYYKTDFEKVEYYKSRLKTQIGFTIVMCILMFIGVL